MYISYKKMLPFKFVDLYVNKIFLFIHFFSYLVYNLTGKWNFDIDFFQALRWLERF